MVTKAKPIPSVQPIPAIRITRELKQSLVIPLSELEEALENEGDSATILASDVAWELADQDVVSITVEEWDL